MKFNYVKILMTLLVLGTGFYLFKVINEPIRFKSDEKERRAAVIDRLKEIRQAQFYYKDLKSHFADNFDSLIYTLTYDTFIVIRVMGNPDDTNQVIRRDTSYILARDSVFTAAGHSVEDLQYIPYSNKKKFFLDADVIESNKVRVHVFQASALYRDIFHDRDTKLFDKHRSISVGSLTEASYAGNWE
ncbi:MAG: hypothetical protein IIA45_13455 [Bacteroidetes bacterium]|nr:hypothetical protein [Bacteroidota bacterium]